MLRLISLALLGICLPLIVAFPANNAAVKVASLTGPTKYAACKSLDCPPFRVVQKIAPDVELREYSRVWWASAKAQAPRINRNVTTPLYWLLRGYISNSNKQLQTLKSKFCNNGSQSANKGILCQRRTLKMGVPVTKLIESTKTGMKEVTMSFYLSVPSPPRPSDSKVWLEYKPLQVYVKIFKGRSFYIRMGEGHAHILANDLIRRGVDGTAFYPPSAKYMTAGYDGPFIPRRLRTNEVWLIKKPSSIK
ncbi:uncharacterized protein LOC116289537 [Actinia tenebrosa]|uniref:Uncharacterized protein LOC116289537 n=1 Tax=Actinia tenebrosa TaxID=6105 RepID=A0A6P8HB48_ACTTE|nr:uncharacterized protein LOC116289537 [Actinia tenebrosa]XP_031552343.1 uncharacterized protein LOC116289537 [Actinia tenebrosa]